MTITDNTPSAPSQLQFTATTEFEQVAYGYDRNLFVMASVTAPTTETEERQSRAPIDIVCVIDRSGSMAGTKLDLVKKTLSFMVDQLKDEDNLSLVLFDDQIDTPLQLTKMSKQGKTKANEIIKGIYDGGSTNLSGGLFEGFEQIKRRIDPRDVASILLFTDGLANVGVTDTKSIVAGTEKYLQQIGKAVSIFTFGFGGDHDANMLRSIAEAGNGLYYYLQREDEIPQSFADCLGGLLSVSAQNIKLKIETLENGVELKTIHNSYKKTTDTPTCVELSLGDLYSEESRDIVLEVKLNMLRSELERQELVKFTLTYYNVTNQSGETLEVTATVKRPTEAPQDQKPNAALDKQRNRVETTNAVLRGRDLADRGNYEEAKQVLRDVKSKIQVSTTANESYSSNLMGDLDDVMEGMSDVVTYASRGSKVANAVWSENHRQRSNKPMSKFVTKKKMDMQDTYERNYK
jgi:Mg-chelatase subunit ChlD